MPLRQKSLNFTETVYFQTKGLKKVPFCDTISKVIISTQRTV